ncbi:tyrosine-type recombinase/integrase [Rhodanobacter denitrificans]|uniref:tyrosine-type recombinase/integrase n=1 Tax=Rhodanobacter denitrificans TaxID=666685 RepID=UPI001F1957A9|nr:site-specific integrase [Rhodanobacter denitrificans]UJJ58324.1 site-specific integrase [Rhodanobacter denitrificans]
MSPALSGRAGTNRAPVGVARQIAADNDVAAMGLWLAEYHDSPHTFRSYRKEAERLLLWSVQVRGKPVSSLTREDVIAYETFLADPPAAWCDAGLGRRGEHRRLFAGPLGERSRRQALGILAGLFNYLVRAGYLAGSPFVLQRRRARRGSRRTMERYLDRALWDDVLQALDDWPRASERECQRYERARWVLRFLYESALRVSEAAASCENDFQRVRGRWWLRTVGKGGVEGQIPLSDELMEDFARYRRFYALAPLPAESGRMPAILGIAGRSSSLTPTTIYQIVKDTFRRIADALESQDSGKASRVRRASTHWLRHTAATHQAEAGTPVHHIQQNLRHSSIGTTSIYLHAEEDARHASTTQPRPVRSVPC